MAKKQEVYNEMPYKICHLCFLAHPIATRVCHECGYEFYPSRKKVK